MLKKIQIKFENKNERLSWYTWYEYVKKYYAYYGNSDIKLNFNTDDGFTYKVDGKFALGV